MNRTPQMQNFVDGFSKKAFGKSLSEAWEGAICVICKNEIKGFKDKLSEKEYSISGMCQECQDKFFGC